MTSLGLFIQGPFSHVWFRYIQPFFAERILPRISATYFAKKQHFRIAVASVFFDLIAMDTPLISAQLFVAGLMNSKWKISEGWRNLKEKLMTALKCNWGLQPFFNFVVYYLVPRQLRATCDLLYAVVFSSIFSYIENQWKGGE